jgi:hypothetical protein
METGSNSHGRNHAMWLGPLITFAGMVSYFTVFVRWPALRDFPWVNLPLVLAGVALSILAFRRRRRTSLLSRILAGVGLGFSALIAGLFVFYVFFFSSTLPTATTLTAELEQAPDFALSDQHSRVVSLADLRGEKAVLVFFRGFW